MTPIEILNKLITLSFLLGYGGKKLIEKLPEEEKEILKNLKSDDIKRVRIK